MNKNLPIIFTYLKELFPNPETELHYSTPFQLVVAVMLSAQATDLQVNKVTEKFFKKIQKPEDLLALGFPSFKTAIRSINYYNTKAKHIYETASLLMKNEKLRIKNYKHWIPNTLEELMKLPWVGVKTGKLIAHVLYDKPFIAVDTHIHRVSNRLWLVKSPILKDTSPLHTISPEKTSELLEKIIPDSYKDHAHHSLVLFGRYYCKAVKPKCESCKLQKICDYYKNQVQGTR
jgi:endonuclease III